ncbi:hypothetical protein K525DRAFT_275638 [Schizophyllum commune Loenen D]|nr:hypothetical protein K525DRAFT_275638 [Schizophyllum commune Loenen D]
MRSATSSRAPSTTPTIPLFMGWCDLGNRAATFPDILAATCPNTSRTPASATRPSSCPPAPHNLVCAMRDTGELTTATTTIKHQPDTQAAATVGGHQPGLRRRETGAMAAGARRGRGGEGRREKGGGRRGRTPRAPPMVSS